MKPDKLWRQLPAAEYAALFPARPKAIRKIAYGLRRLGAGYDVFTMNQWELAEACGVSVRTLARYLPLFESYGIIDVKRWRYRRFGTAPNSYRTYFGNVIPPDWAYGGGDYRISARDHRCNDAERESRPE